MISEETDIHIRIPKRVFEIITELRSVEIMDESIELFRTSDVAREALYKGLAIMTAEKIEFLKVVEASKKTKPAENGQTIAGNEVEESVLENKANV